MRQRMTDKLADAAKKAWKGVAVLACCEAVLGLLAGRVATLVFRANPINPMSGLATASPTLVTDIALNPFDVAMGEPFVRGAVGAVVLGTLALALVYLSRGMRLKNEDTENSHGKDRLATEREAGMFVDHAHPYNNLMVSEHAGIVLNPHDPKTRDQQAEKNLNCVTLGISGLGKTYNLVYPDMMRACGTALPAIPCAKRGKPDKEVALPLPAGKTEAQMGFDVFATDTKGDTLRDCGEMLEKAKFDLRVFNTISLLDGQSYNPFASRYVKTHLVDKYDPEQMSVGGRVDWRGAETRREHSEAFAQDADLYRPKTVLARSGKGFVAQIDMRLGTEMTSIEGVDMSGGESLEDIEARLKDAEGEAAEALRAKRDRKLMEGAMGAFGDVMQAVRYQRTTGTVDVHVRNCGHENAVGRVSLELSPGLVPAACSGTGVKVDAKRRDDGGFTVEWDTGEVEPGRDSQAHLSLDVYIEPMRVADGVALTKIVDTMCANLAGTEAPAGADGDFWESCKRLFFMGIAAFLFEKYEEESRTIPEMMRLLDLAVPPRGGDPHNTPLGILMEEWETGLRDEWADDASGERGAARTKRKVRTAMGPHSRSRSLALHCYYAIEAGAEDTFRSVLISCQSALKNLVTLEVQQKLLRDDMRLDELGNPGQKSAVFCIIKDTDNPLQFVTAVMVQQAIDLAQDKAYMRFGGKLPRHVRFVLDEVANVGKIPILVRALAVVRSRNISISLFFQSKAQIAKVYGDKECSIVFDNCSTMVYLGAQDSDTLKMISERVGDETVASRTFQRTFQAGSMNGSTSENIGLTSRKVMSVGQVRALERGYLLVFMTGLPGAVLDRKVQTSRDPYYPYICPGHECSEGMPEAVCEEPFDLKGFLRRKEAEEEERKKAVAATKR